MRESASFGTVVDYERVECEGEVADLLHER
jgi:hypothetical protein